MESIEATPSGCLFAEWIARRGCAKSTAYRMRQELGIAPWKRRQGTAVEVWLTGPDEALMTAYADALGRGLSTAEALAEVGRSPRPMDSDGPLPPLELGEGALAPMESIEPIGPAPMESDGEALLLLRRKLAALRDALELGAPLSTAEVALLLGARPGGPEVVRGRIRAIRQRRNLWTLEPD